jgi:hypothetical protein
MLIRIVRFCRFGVAGRNVLGIGVAFDPSHADADALSRAVSLLGFRARTALRALSHSAIRALSANPRGGYLLATCRSRLFALEGRGDVLKFGAWAVDADLPVIFPNLLGFKNDLAVLVGHAAEYNLSSRYGLAQAHYATFRWPTTGARGRLGHRTGRLGLAGSPSPGFCGERLSCRMRLPRWLPRIVRIEARLRTPWRDALPASVMKK